MDKAAHTIEAHIDRTRERLGSNLKELENKVDAATDWREQFRARPHLFLGGALAGGALLAAVFRPASVRQEFEPANDAPLASFARNGGVNTQEQAFELWNDVKAALIAVAAARLTDYIGELVPGFQEHFRNPEQRASAPRG
jgi:hypothetical protein